MSNSVIIYLLIRLSEKSRKIPSLPNLVFSTTFLCFLELSSFGIFKQQKWFQFECCGVKSYADWLSASWDRKGLSAASEDGKMEHGIGSVGGGRGNGFGRTFINSLAIVSRRRMQLFKPMASYSMPGLLPFNMLLDSWKNFRNCASLVLQRAWQTSLSHELRYLLQSSASVDLHRVHPQQGIILELMGFF